MKKRLFSAATAFCLLLTISLSTLSYHQAHAEETDVMRVGSCFFDGKANCRYKKTGTVCKDRVRCSFKSAITAIGTAATTIIAVSNIK